MKVLLINYRASAIVLMLIGLSSLMVTNKIAVTEQAALKSILTALSIVSLGLFVRIIWLISVAQEKSSLCIDRIRLSIKRKSETMLISALNNYESFQNEFDWYSSKKIDDFNFLVATFRSLLNAIELIKNSNWDRALELLDGINLKRVKKVCSDNWITGEDQVINIISINKQACKGYLNNSIKISNGKAYELANRFHISLNSLSSNPVDVVVAFFEIATYWLERRSIKNNNSGEDLINMLLTEILLFGCYGTIKEMDLSFPWYDKGSKDRLIKMLSEYGLDSFRDTELSILKICEGILLKMCRIGTINDFFEIELRYWNNRLSDSSPLLNILKINVELINRNNPKILNKCIGVLKKSGDYFKSIVEITSINLLGLYINDGYKNKEEYHYDEAMMNLNSISNTSFYYDGYLLNNYLIELISNESYLPRLKRLSKESNNYMVVSQSLKNLLIVYAREYDVESFQKTYDQYIKAASRKNYALSSNKFEVYRTGLFTTGIWHFVRVPIEYKYYPYFVNVLDPKVQV